MDLLHNEDGHLFIYCEKSGCGERFIDTDPPKKAVQEKCKKCDKRYWSLYDGENLEKLYPHTKDFGQEIFDTRFEDYQDQMLERAFGGLE